MSQPINELIKLRKEKLVEIKKIGVNPYPAQTKRTHTAAEAKKLLGKKVAVAGRVMAWRGHGKMQFADLVDQSGKIQLVFKIDEFTEKDFKFLRLLNIGDFLSAEGEVFKTKAGEISVLVKSYQILVKSILPLPDQWYGLKDVEERYRKRYLDMILNSEVSERLLIRSRLTSAIREFLDNKGFLEVETPTLQPVYGGGFARPFITHHNALGSDFYLRISDEMYLKRLIVGGLEKVYEITKVFRNEGVDYDHNPEFTMFEAQIAYEDYHYGMDIIEELTEYIVKKSLGTTKVKYQETELNFARPWKRYRMVEAIKEFTDLDPLKWQSLVEAKEAAKKLNLPEKQLADLKRMLSVGEVIAFVFEEAVEEKLIQPTIIYDFPIEVSPLAKKCEDPRFTQRFEQFLMGTEFGNNYSELNDPLDLRKRFVEEKKREKAGFEEAHQTDLDYLEAIECGFPPTCGVAIGIDRLVMLITNSTNLKEVIAFPTLKPEHPLEIKSVKVKGGILSLSSVFASKYPSASVGYALIKGIKVNKQNLALEAEKKELLLKYKDLSPENINKFSEVQAYRKMYQQMRVDLHSRKPSPEALLMRIVRGKGLYTVNTCVDAYNLVVMKNRVSLGAFDLDKLKLPCRVDIAKGGEQIDLLGKGLTKLRSGEVAYFDQIGAYNLDYNYRDADRTKITDKTVNIMLNVDGIFEISEDKVLQSLHESIQLIRKYCGGDLLEVGILSAKGGLKKIDSLVTSRQTEKSSKYGYRERKIVAVINIDLPKGLAGNALGHLAFSAGHWADESWIERERYIDASGQKHVGIARHPLIVLEADKNSIKEIVSKARGKEGVAMVDYPQEMFDTGTDEDLNKAISKTTADKIVYQAVVLVGPSKEVDDLTKGLKLYG